MLLQQLGCWVCLLQFLNMVLVLFLFPATHSFLLTNTTSVQNKLNCKNILYFETQEYYFSKLVVQQLDLNSLEYLEETQRQYFHEWIWKHLICVLLLLWSHCYENASRKALLRDWGVFFFHLIGLYSFFFPCTTSVSKYLETEGVLFIKVFCCSFFLWVFYY